MTKIMLKVKSSDGKAFWERHPAHPGGELFVAGDQVKPAARTRAVSTALKSGRLVEVKPTRRKKKVEDAEDATEKA